MGWADLYSTELLEGKTIQFRPTGGSMRGKIESGQLCTLIPICADTSLSIGDIVLCRVKGSVYLHLIKSIQNIQQTREDEVITWIEYLIGNNKGRINGWVTRNTIYGKCIKVEN